MRKFYIVIIVGLLLTIITSISTILIINKQENTNMLNAKETVEALFKYQNEKNEGELKTLLSHPKRDIQWELNKIQYVKLLSIKEDNSDTEKKSYLQLGNGNSFKPFDIKIIKTEFDIKFYDNSGSGMSDGKYYWNYIVIKENISSPWLIYDWGV